LRRLLLDGVIDRDRNASTEGLCDLAADDPRWLRVILKIYCSPAAHVSDWMRRSSETRH
jgi:hypothetical protein